MMRERPRRVALVLVAALAAGGCGPALFTDGSSVSVGTFGNGLLRHGRRLRARGEGYVIPSLWQARGANWATDELVAAIARAARRVRREYPGGLLGVGDLSRRGGGDSELHRSHENGRDADLIFYAVDERGRPLAPANAMPRYGDDLRSLPPRPTKGVVFGPVSPRRFDVRRNWALVRALLEDPEIEVQYLFLSEPLKRALLDYAASSGEDPALVEEAEALLHQPGDSLPHDDHLHLRIYCAATDRFFGCVDRGPTRWWKKRWKYMPPGTGPVLDEVIDLLGRIGVLPPTPHL
jgi:penicillin-insensitive murein endopeptidase